MAMTGAANTPDLTVVVLTKNEDIHLGRMLQSVASIAAKIIVVDSFSTDRTVEIAQSSGAEVVQRQFLNHADQFQWALDSIPITTDWIMRLDADEIVEPELAEEIVTRLPGLAHDIVGVNLNRKHIFMGRWIRHGGRYPLVLLRLWRRGHGRIEQRWMDEHIIVDGGRTVTFLHPFVDHNLKGLTFFIDKHNGYATREAIDVVNQRRKLFPRDDSVKSAEGSRQAAIKRAIKENIFNKIPFVVGVPLYFIFRFVFQLGFLDGKEGFFYHVFQGLWYRLLVGAKVAEIEAATSHIQDIGEVRTIVSSITGHPLTSFNSHGE